MIRQFIVRICDDCVNLRGQQCHNPECCLCRRTMDEVGEILDVLMIRPIVDGERMPVCVRDIFNPRSCKRCDGTGKIMLAIEHGVSDFVDCPECVPISDTDMKAW